MVSRQQPPRTLAGLATAFALTTLIGAERQWRQRSAGLRTNVLVAIGPAAFANLGTRSLGADGATRIISYIVSGKQQSKKPPRLPRQAAIYSG